jgi:hypothetical protein
MHFLLWLLWCGLDQLYSLDPISYKSAELVTFASVHVLTSLWTVRSHHKLCIHKAVYLDGHDPRDPTRLQTWHMNTTSAFNSYNILELLMVKHPKTRQFLCYSHIKYLLWLMEWMRWFLITWFRTRLTERRGRVVNNPVSYSGGPGFKSRPRRTAILIEVFL